MSWPKGPIRYKGTTRSFTIRAFHPETEIVFGSLHPHDPVWMGIPLEDLLQMNTEAAHAFPELAERMKGKVKAVGFGADEKQALYEKETKKKMNPKLLGNLWRHWVALSLVCSMGIFCLTLINAGYTALAWFLTIFFLVSTRSLWSIGKK